MHRARAKSSYLETDLQAWLGSQRSVNEGLLEERLGSGILAKGQRV